MESQLNSFQKGMNLDVHPSFLDENQYLEAFNSAIYNQLNSNNFIGNEAGFKNIVQNFDELSKCMLLGMIPFENDIIVFSIRINDYVTAIQQGLFTTDGFTNPDTWTDGTLQNSLWSEIGLLRRQPDLTYIYETILADKTEQYWVGGNIDVTELLSFQPTHQIDAVARRDAANRLIVYWTDGLNKPRRLVLTDENNQSVSYTGFFRNMAKETLLIGEYSYPVVQYLETIEGGNLYSGVYQFTARYLNDTFDPTDFGYVSPPVPVVDDFRYEGRANYDGCDPTSPKIEKSIRLKINNVDTTYKYLQLVVIFQDPATFTKIYKTLGRISVPQNTLTDYTSVEYIFDGSVAEGEDQTLSESEILFRSPHYASAQHIEQKDGRLFLANLTQVVRPNLQYIANRLRLQYQVDHIVVSDDSSFFGDYKEEANTFYRKGYRRDEVYSFAIVGIFDDGTISDAFHIPGYVEDQATLDNEIASSPDDESYIAPLLSGYQTEDFGYLEAYVSLETYNDGDYSSGDQTVQLNGQRVRHHKFPSSIVSPHVKTLTGGDVRISIMGVRVEGIEEALLAESLDEVTSLYVQKHLVQLVLVRELRDKRTNKSIISQGCLNRLMKQSGRNINLPIQFDIDYKLGTIPTTIKPIDAVVNAVFAAINPIYSIGLNNITFNGRIRPYNIDATYCIDPYWGNTSFGRTPDSPIIFNNGKQIDGRNNNFAFFSPEENFLLDFTIPTNSTIQNVITCKGEIDRVINTRIEPNQTFLDGSYSNNLKYPYFKKYRGAYYHLFSEFNDYKTSPIPTVKELRSVKRTKYNEVVVSNESLKELYTHIIEDYTNPNSLTSNIKLNNYENEGYMLLNLNEIGGSNGNQLFLDTFYNSSTIEIQLGCRFNILYAPYLPLWLLRMLEFNNDYMTMGDTTGVNFGGVGEGHDVAKVLITSINLVLGIAVAVADAVSIRGAVIDLRELQEDRGKIAGSNQIVFDEKANREIYSIKQENDRQYLDVTLGEYFECGILFSPRSINNNNDTSDLNRYRINADTDEISYTRSIFGGDTFINKYFFKTSYNLAYQVPNVFQNELNKYTLDHMNDGGAILYLPTFSAAGAPIPVPTIPLPNFLCMPGGVFFGSISTLEGRTFDIPIFPIDTDSELGVSGLRTVEIQNELVYDPLYPALYSNENDSYESGKFGTQMRGGNWIWLESSINCDYRHRPLSYIESKAKLQGENNFTNTPDYDNARLGVPYYPKDSLQWCYEVSPEYGASNGYDQRYSSENNVQLYTVPRIIPFETNQFRYRTIYSESIYDVSDGKGGNRFMKSELSDKYRIFFPRNYQDVSKDKGQITNIFINNDEFYIHTEKSLFKAYVNPLIQTTVPDGKNLILAKAGVFEILPKEVYSSTGGFAGCKNKWASITTPNGHTFVDIANRKVYNLTDSLEEISQIGLKNWFYQNLNSITDNSALSYDNVNINKINNPANPYGIGLSAFYDPLCNRYVLSIKREANILELDIENSTIKNSVNSNNISVSFSYSEKCWISFHNYCSAISLTNDQYVYSCANLLNSNNLGVTNQVVVHNRYVGDPNFTVYSLYGLYYEQIATTPTSPPIIETTEVIKPFSIKYVCNKDSLTTKTYDNLVVFGQCINENRGYLRPMVHFNDFFNTMHCYNDYCNSGKINIRMYPLIGSGTNLNDDQGLWNEQTTNAKQYNNEWRLNLPFSNIVSPDSPTITNPNTGEVVPVDFNLAKYIDVDIYDPTNMPNFNPELMRSTMNRPRLKGKYLIIELAHNNRNDFYNNISQEVDNQNLTKDLYNLHFVLFGIQTKFRINHR